MAPWFSTTDQDFHHSITKIGLTHLQGHACLPAPSPNSLDVSRRTCEPLWNLCYWEPVLPNISLAETTHDNSVYQIQVPVKIAEMHIHLGCATIPAVRNRGIVLYNTYRDCHLRRSAHRDGFTGRRNIASHIRALIVHVCAACRKAG